MAILQRTSVEATAATGYTFDVASNVAHRPPAGCSISLVTSSADLSLFASAWKRLEASAGPAHRAFQSFDWLTSWATCYNPELSIVTGFQGEDMVFVWPLMRTRLGPLTVLRWMSEPYAQYGDVIAAPGQSPAVWLDRATAFLRRTSSADIVRLRHVRDDALASPYLRNSFSDSRHEELAPWLDFTAFADEKAYDARYSSNQRKRRKKIRKALEDDFGPVAFAVLADGPELAAALNEAIAEKCQWIDERGRHNRVLRCPRLPSFLQTLLDNQSGGARLVMSRLTAGGRPVSWEIGIRYGTTHFCYITSHVNALTDYSPARLHMDFSQRQALKDGCCVFDLMVPNDTYKDSWCSARMPARDYHLALTPLGRLFGAGYLEQLRPRLREAYYNMSPRILRLLKPVIGH